MRRTSALAAALLASLMLLAGCEQLGIESPEKVAAARDADGKAIGGACRHAGRPIEDCYTLNKKADRAAIFAGWREMNDYMRENKIDAVPPQLTAQAATPKPADGAEAVADEVHGDKGGKPGEKADKAGAGKPKGKSHDS